MTDDARSEAESLIHRYYNAFNAGDGEALIALLADDVAHDVNQGGQRRGKAAFADFLAHMDRCYHEQLTDIVVMASEDGRRGAAEFVVNGTYKQTDEGLPPARGQTYRLPAGTFFAIENGRIARVTTHYNLNDWISQVEAA